MTPEQMRKLRLGDVVMADLFGEGPVRCIVTDLPQSSGITAIEKPDGKGVIVNDTNCCYVRLATPTEALKP